MRFLIPFAVVLVFVAGNASAATPVTTCITIDTPGYYYLVNDIINASSTCINITASDVVLDGRGHVIDGVHLSYSYGIDASSVQNVTVINLAVREFYYGVYFTNVNSSRVENCTISRNAVGVVLESSSSNTISNNTISSNDGSGVRLEFSSGNTIADNTIIINYWHGVSLGFSSNNTISNNTIIYNYSPEGGAIVCGISLYSSYSDTIIDNTINSNGCGVFLDSYNTMVAGNTISNNWWWGVTLSSFISDNLIYNNLFNNTQNVQSSSPSYNAWNTTKQVGTNIVGGSYIGGNYWGKPDGTGYSDTCGDADGDGICDAPYVIDANNTDYLPLTSPVGMPEFQGYAALSAFVPWVSYLLLRRWKIT